MAKKRTKRIECAECRQRTRHAVLFEREVQDFFEPMALFWGSIYYVLRCRGCEAITFCREDWNSDEEDEATGKPILKTRLFPPRISEIPDLPFDAVNWLPGSLRALRYEVVQALLTDSLILAAVGIRALVEGFCREQGATGRTLKQLIDDAKESGKIPWAYGDLMHIQREIGNDAAHQLSPPTHQELLELLQIADQLFRSTYEAAWFAAKAASRESKG